MLKRHKDLVIILIILFSFYSFFTFILPGCTGQGKTGDKTAGTESATLAQEPVTTTTTTTTTTPTSQEPNTPAATKYAYVSVSGDAGGWVEIYNADTFAFEKKMEGVAVPSKMCFSHTKRSDDINPKYLYVANYTDVKRFNLETQLIDPDWFVNIGASCREVAVSIDDSLIYAFRYLQKIMVYNVETKLELPTSPIKHQSNKSSFRSMGLTPNGETIVIADGGFGSAWGEQYHIPFARTSDNTIYAETLTDLDRPQKVAMDPQGVYAVIAINNMDDVKKLAVVNIQSRDIVSSIDLTYEPFGITIAPDRTRAYVTKHEDKKVTIVSLDAGGNLVELADKINVGELPDYPAISSNGKYLWVPCAGEQSRSTYVIKTSDNTVHKILPAVGGSGPIHVLLE